MAAFASQATVAVRSAQQYTQMARWAAQLQSIQQLGVRLLMDTQARTQRAGSSTGALYRAGGVVLLVIAVLHVLVYVGFSLTPGYPGILFLLNVAASVVLAVGVFLRFRPAWHLSALFAAGTIVLFVLVRTVGLPAFHLTSWTSMVGFLPLGPLSLIAEGLLLALYAVERSR